ncbi:MAG: hypothetical protein RSF39_09975 [Romboutsia sp.]
MKKTSIKNNKFNKFTITYMYKNGVTANQEIVSCCTNATELTEIVGKQLARAKRAKFKVLTGNKLINGWLLNMDIKNFSIE